MKHGREVFILSLEIEITLRGGVWQPHMNVRSSSNFWYKCHYKDFTRLSQYRSKDYGSKLNYNTVFEADI